MSIKYNTIEFCREDYKDDGEHDEFAMWSDIQEFLRIAIKNGYQMKIWDDGETIVVEYNYRDELLSDIGLEWLDCDQYEKLNAEDGTNENNTES